MTSKATGASDSQPLLGDARHSEEMFVQSRLYLPRRYVMVALFFTCIGMLHAFQSGLMESVVFAYLMRVNMTVVATNIVEVLRIQRHSLMLCRSTTFRKQRRA
jgi:hypothetical protein